MKLVSLENITKYNELLNKKIVKSVNSVKPDSNGNVQLGTEKSTFNKVVYDTGYFSIAASNTYTFDLTGSDLENVSKDNVNIHLVAKVVTTHNGFEVGDIAQLSPGLGISPDWKELDVCAYIRGNTLYFYSGSNVSLSIRSETNWLEKNKVQIKAVLTAFVPDDGSILLIAEDQTNTSKLIGLPDGTLTWGNKNLVRSVNGVNADENGNVNIGFMPDYSSKVSLSTNTVYTAPCDCLVCIYTNDKSGGDSIAYLEVQDSNGNVILAQKNRFRNGTFTSCGSVNLPIPKGTIFKAIANSTDEAYICYFPYK